MIRWVVSVAMVSALAGCASNNGEQADDDEGTEARIAWAQAPAGVRNAFARDFPGVTVTECEIETYKSGLVHYEVEYTDAPGNEHDVEYTADGGKLDPH